MTRADKLLIVAILLFALAGMGMIYRHFFSLNQHLPCQATITAGGKVLQVIDLNPANGTQTFQVVGRVGPATVEVSDGKIRMKKSNCSQQICVKQGWIQGQGDSIICLPGEIVIHIDGPTTIDAVTR